MARKKTEPVTVESRIGGFMEYFRGMEVSNGIIVVNVQLKKKWGMAEPSSKDIIVECMDTAKNLYRISADIRKVTISDVFDFIDSVIALNIDVQNKKTLLTQKYEELVQLFSDYTLDELKTLKFVITKKRGRRKVNESEFKESAIQKAEQNPLPTVPSVMGMPVAEQPVEIVNYGDEVPIAEAEPIHDNPSDGGTYVFKASDLDNIGY